ncbi:Uncharacterised protein [Actinobaculum suis]|uniref:Uncharacterized protein n=3 Tax=Actinobaculum suis TaxID=1657 RepID=A0A1B9BEG0_9ACTO|nr:hypothetical protein ACU21_00585 [Actinobaculum suis]VDG76878.1 Uncharacterised protein [Actinobaculum suis]
MATLVSTGPHAWPASQTVFPHPGGMETILPSQSRRSAQVRSAALTRLGVFSIAEAFKHGVSPRMLRSPLIKRVSRGFYALAATTVTELDLLAAFARRFPQAVVCHASAARFWGFPLPRRIKPWEEGVHICLRVTTKKRRKITNGVRWSYGKVPKRDVVVIKHPRTRTPIRIMARERAFIDICKSLTVHEATEIADYLVRQPRPGYEKRRRPFSSGVRLMKAVRAHRRKRGIRVARLAVSLSRRGADSAQETRCRLTLMAAGFPEPRVNAPIRDLPESKRTPDLQYDRHHLALEYDGAHHRLPEQRQSDFVRRAERTAVHWREEIFTADDLRPRYPETETAFAPTPFHHWRKDIEEWRINQIERQDGIRCSDPRGKAELNLPHLPWDHCELTRRVGLALAARGFDLDSVRRRHPSPVAAPMTEGNCPAERGDSPT